MISPSLLIKLNNFGFFALAACLVPFQSFYFLYFTNATYGDFGKLNFVASILSSLLCFMCVSMTDCRRAHRPVYFISLLVSVGSFVALTCPIVLSRAIKPEANNETLIAGRTNISNQNFQINPLNSLTQLEYKSNTCESILERVFDRECSIASNSSNNVAEETQIFPDYWELAASHRSYFFSSCLVAGSAAFATAFSAISLLNVKISTDYEDSCDSTRGWSCLGWILASVILLPTIRFGLIGLLLSSLILFIALGVLNLLTMSFLWTSSSFVMISNGRAVNLANTRFEFGTESWFAGKTISNYKKDLTLTAGGNFHHCGSVVVTKFRKSSLFDSRDEDLYRNIRRCSLAPLGDSHVIKQFELDNKNGKHFYHVTKIEPSGGANNSNPQTIEYNALDAYQLPDYCSQCATNKRFGMLLGFRLIKLLVKQNGFIMLKFLLLIVANGFLAAMNWYFLFPYLFWLDSEKIALLATSINLAVGLSGALICTLKPQFIRSISRSVGLSLILILYGLRYSLYTVFIISHQSIPLEMIVLVELLYAVAGSWFCTLSLRLIMEFSRLASNCVPELIETGWIDNNMEAIDRFNEGARGIMLNLLLFCFNGVGLSLGSLVGGLLIDSYGFTTLWVVSATAAYLVGLMNILFDLIIYYNNKNGHHQPSVNEGR